MHFVAGATAAMFPTVSLPDVFRIVIVRVLVVIWTLTVRLLPRFGFIHNHRWSIQLYIRFLQIPRLRTLLPLHTSGNPVAFHFCLQEILYVSCSSSFLVLLHPCHIINVQPFSNETR